MEYLSGTFFTGLWLELIPMKIGAGVTNGVGFFSVIPANAGIQ
jgi:hypothetical protein